MTIIKSMLTMIGGLSLLIYGMKMLSFNLRKLTGGKLEQIDVFTLREKNLFFTAPTLEMYMANRHELILSSATLLDFVKKGIIVPSVSNYGFDGIQQAHIDMEDKNSIGSLVINV